MSIQRTIVTAAAALALVACGESSTPSDDFPIPLLDDCIVTQAGDLYIGSMYPIEFLGGIEPGILLAIAEINEAGGINGQQLGIIKCDSDPFGGEDAANNAIQELIAIPQLAGIVGPGFSSVSVRVGPVAAAANKVMVATTATAASLTYLDDDGYFFRTAISDALEGAVAAAVVKADGHTSAFVIYPEDTFGTGLKDVFAAKFGSDNVASYGYDQENAAFAEEAFAAVEAAQPDVVYLVAYNLELIAISQQAVLREDTFKPAWVVYSSTNDTEFAMSSGNPSYWVGSKSLSIRRGGNGVETYRQLALDAYGQEPTGQDNSAYDATYLMAIGLLLSDDPTSGTELRDNLAHTSTGREILPGEWAKVLEHVDEGTFNYEGGAGHVDFDSNGDISGNFQELVLQSSISYRDTRCWTGEGGELSCE